MLARVVNPAGEIDFRSCSSATGEPSLVSKDLEAVLKRIPFRASGGVWVPIKPCGDATWLAADRVCTETRGPAAGAVRCACVRLAARIETTDRIARANTARLLPLMVASLLRYQTLGLLERLHQRYLFRGSLPMRNRRSTVLKRAAFALSSRPDVL